MKHAIALLLTCVVAAFVAPSPTQAAAAPALVAVQAATPPAATATTPVPASEAPREIAALLSLLRVSPCRFERNGRWYDGAKAAAHLQNKLDHAVGRGIAPDSSERFIEEAASRSSLSGRPYRVKCGDAAPIPAATWFRARLRELRTP